MPVFVTFRWFFLIFSVMVLNKYLWFFALCSVSKDASFELSKSTFRKNFKFLTIRGVKISQFGFTSSYRRNETISEILRENSLQKQSARHSCSYLVYMASAQRWVPLHQSNDEKNTIKGFIRSGHDGHINGLLA